MAKKKENKRVGTLRSVVLFFRDDKARYTIGILLIFIAIYLTLSFVSYFFNWKTDQDFRWENVFSGPEIKVANQGGKFGAWLSDLFMNRWFGLSGFLVPYILVVLTFSLYRFRVFKTWKTVRNSLIMMILLSITLGLIFGEGGGFLGSGPGGGHGYFISRWMIASMGFVGSLFVLLACYAALLFFSTSFVSWIRTNPLRAFEKELSDENVPEGFEQEAPDEKEAEEEMVNDDTAFVIRSVRKEPEVPLREQAPPPPVAEKQVHEEELPHEDDLIELTVDDGSVAQTEDFNPDEGALVDYDPTLDLSEYKFPPLSLMNDYDQGDSTVSNEELLSNKNKIVETLGNYKIKIDKIKATIGPTVTLYEIVPAPGIRISKIKSLEDDIALSLSALGIRIIAPIPGKGTIGIEVPNLKPRTVSMKSILASKKFQESEYDLAIAIGKTISNETFVFDLARMPHLLVAGATGQGKSVGLNAIITSLLYKKHPAQLKFVMIDPKKVELSLYAKIERHFLAMLPDAEEPIITDTHKVIQTLNSLCAEMDERYNLLKIAQVRNIREYNQKFINRKLNPNKGHRFMPFIVVIIDEFADLIMTAGREIEHPIARLAQLARAIGIHLVIATQRPTTNIITGVIKANFPARIAFRVTSVIDSRTILDSSGAEQLIGRGDMLISSGNEPIRLQCAFIDTPEVEDITEYIGGQRGYPSALMLKPVEEEGGEAIEVDLRKRDEKFEEAARLVIQYQQGSTSLIQRKLSLGYNRAGRIVDQLEAAGILGPFEGSKARQVLIQDEMSLEQILKGLE
ncbi:MAG: DNA translocase FtsK 4TM domain-containing protein [Bacteroidota bacterium]